MTSRDAESSAGASGCGRCRRTRRRTHRPDARAARRAPRTAPAGRHGRSRSGRHLDRLVDVVGDEQDRSFAARAACAGTRPAVAPAIDRDRAPPNGSSISSTGGSAASARATPTRCAWPPESSLRIAVGELRRRSAPMQLEQLVRPLRAVRASRPSREPRHDGDVLADRHVAETGRSAGSRSRCRAAARPGRSAVVSRPSMKILPAVGATSRLIIRSVVVLPQPDGPSSTQISPVAHFEAHTIDRGDRPLRRRISLGQRLEPDHGQAARGAEPLAASERFCSHSSE